MIKCICFLLLLSFQKHLIISQESTLPVQKRIEILKMLLLREIAEEQNQKTMLTKPMTTKPQTTLQIDENYHYVGFDDDGPIKPIIQYKGRTHKHKRMNSTKKIRRFKTRTRTTRSTTSTTTVSTKITPAQVYHRRFSEITTNLNNSTNTTLGTTSLKSTSSKML